MIFGGVSFLFMRQQEKCFMKNNLLNLFRVNKYLNSIKPHNTKKNIIWWPALKNSNHSDKCGDFEYFE